MLILKLSVLSCFVFFFSYWAVSLIAPVVLLLVNVVLVLCLFCVFIFYFDRFCVLCVFVCVFRVCGSNKLLDFKNTHTHMLLATWLFATNRLMLFCFNRTLGRFKSPS